MLAKPRLNDLVVLEKHSEKDRMPPGSAIRFAPLGRQASLQPAADRSDDRRIDVAQCRASSVETTQQRRFRPAALRSTR
jgi:hypothetical protein